MNSSSQYLSRETLSAQLEIMGQLRDSAELEHSTDSVGVLYKCYTYKR
jgi:hypothetical protein